MSNIEAETRFTNFAPRDTTRRELLASNTPIIPEAEFDLLVTDDGRIFQDGEIVPEARFGGRMPGGRAVRRSGPKKTTAKGGSGPKKRSERVHEAMVKYQGYGLGKGVWETSLLIPASVGIWQAGGIAATVSKVTGFVGLAVSETVNLALIGALALVPGAGGAAYWLLKKFIKSAPGRLFAWRFPNAAKRIADTVAAGWLFMDKLAYQTAQTGSKDKFWSVNHWVGAVASIPAYAYMAYRGANTLVSGLLDCLTLDFRNGTPKVANSFMMLLNMFGGRPEEYYKALIKDDENDINEGNWILRLGNATIGATRDKALDPHELDRDDNDETID